MCYLFLRDGKICLHCPHDSRRIHFPRHSSKTLNELDLEKSLQGLQRQGPGESPGASDY